MVFPFRYTQEGVVKRTPKARASRRVWGHVPQEMFILVASECHCPCFSWGGFINQSIKNTNYSENLSTFGTTDI